MGHSSPEITFKHYLYMWSGVDELIAEEKTGNINIQIAAKTGISCKSSNKQGSARNPTQNNGRCDECWYDRPPASPEIFERE